MGVDYSKRLTRDVFGGELSEDLGISESLRGLSSAEEGEELELTKLELQTAAVGQQSVSVNHSPPGDEEGDTHTHEPTCQTVNEWGHLTHDTCPMNGSLNKNISECGICILPTFFVCLLTHSKAGSTFRERRASRTWLSSENCSKYDWSSSRSASWRERDRQPEPHPSSSSLVTNLHQCLPDLHLPLSEQVLTDDSVQLQTRLSRERSIHTHG